MKLYVYLRPIFVCGLLLCLTGLTLSVQAQTIRYVRQGGSGNGTSWANASPDLQAMINTSGVTQVWVGAGIYKPTTTTGPGSRAISFAMKNGVSILGGFPGTGNPAPADRNPDSFTTTLSGAIGGAGTDDNTYRVIQNSFGLTGTAILDGFVIRDGNANGEGYSSGGGMFNLSASPTLINCSFLNNSATGFGGGLANTNDSRPSLTNCRFLSNSAGVYGGGMNTSNGATLTNCSFQNNSAATQGGGIYYFDYSGNSSTLINCSFLGNSAAKGGGIYYAFNSDFVHQTLINCSFLNNSAASGGGLYINNDIDLFNCVLFGNGGANTITSSISGVDLVYASDCLFETGVTGYSGSANLTAVSPFVSTSSTQLNACSPAINAGSNQAYTNANGPNTDLAGNTRIFPSGGRIDLGAYEFQSTPNQRLTITSQPPSGSAVCVGSSVSVSVAATGTTPLTYQWYKDGSPLSPAQTTATLSLTNVQTTASGSYRVVITNPCGPLISTPFSLTVNALPMASLVASGSLTCAQTSVTLTAGGGGTYAFSGPGLLSQSTNQAVVNAPGPYSVTVTSASGCSATTGFTVGQDNSMPTVSISPASATLSCGNPSLTLMANTGATSLTWSTGATTPSISISLAATYSVSVTASNGCRASAQAIVSGSTSAPLAPSLQASATTTNQPISVTASGCAGGAINWNPQGGTGQANGSIYTFTAPGSYSLSATCTANGCTSPAAPSISLQILPPGFAITSVNMVNCQLTNSASGEYQVRFLPLYSGANTNPISFSVVNEKATTTDPGPYMLRLYTDNPAITLVANQSGNAEARYRFNWLAACQSGTDPNQAPTTTGIPSQTILQGQAYQLQLTNYFSDPDGQALSFQASGLPAGLTRSGSVISGAPSQTGVSMVSITAVDPGGLSVSTSFQLRVSAQPITPPVGFTITGVSTVSCQVLSAGQRRLTFTPQYAGVDGSPISFSVVNESSPTLSAGPYSLNLYTDNPAIILSARQGSAGASYRYNWLAACNATARLGAGEAEPVLQVVVLGNPVSSQTAEIEIRGAEGQAVEVSLTDLQGRPVHRQSVPQAASVERVRVPLGSGQGVLLLQVSTPTQRQQLKLLRQ